jgi:hypothetical protein
MKTGADRSREAERVQAKLLGRATASERTALALSWSQTMLELARNGLRRAHPELGEDELKVLFIEIHHGRQLAEGVRERLRRPPR